MTTQTYNPQSWIGIREAIENAIKMARATGRTIIINKNNVKFPVTADTTIQKALDDYMIAQKRAFEIEKQR